MSNFLGKCYERDTTIQGYLLYEGVDGFQFSRKTCYLFEWPHILDWRKQYTDVSLYVISREKKIQDQNHASKIDRLVSGVLYGCSVI